MAAAYTQARNEAAVNTVKYSLEGNFGSAAVSGLYAAAANERAKAWMS